MGRKRVSKLNNKVADMPAPPLASFTAAQIEDLQKAFCSNSSPSQEYKQQVSINIGISKEAIDHWIRASHGEPAKREPATIDFEEEGRNGEHPRRKKRGAVVVCNDISRGLESDPIRAVNELDDDVLPPEFVYITANEIACEEVREQYNKALTSSKGCTCGEMGSCTTSNGCGCLSASSCGLMYNEQGRLLHAVQAVFECSPFCGCDENCKNKVVSKGVSRPLEVFKTAGKGWGVRSKRIIKAGTFISEYVGEMMTSRDAEEQGQVKDDSYMFNLDFAHTRSKLIDDGSTLIGVEIWKKFPPHFRKFHGVVIEFDQDTGCRLQYDDGDCEDLALEDVKELIKQQEQDNMIGRTVQKMFEGYGEFGGKVISYDKAAGYRVVYEDGDMEDLDLPSLKSILVAKDTTGLEHKAVAERADFCVDAAVKGSVARFINHSCTPNLFIQSVFVEHRDPSLPRLALFASMDIPAMTELAYDYGEPWRSILCDCGKHCKGKRKQPAQNCKPAKASRKGAKQAASKAVPAPHSQSKPSIPTDSAHRKKAHMNGVANPVNLSAAAASMGASSPGSTVTSTTTSTTAALSIVPPGSPTKSLSPKETGSSKFGSLDMKWPLSIPSELPDVGMPITSPMPIKGSLQEELEQVVKATEGDDEEQDLPGVIEDSLSDTLSCATHNLPGRCEAPGESMQRAGELEDSGTVQKPEDEDLSMFDDVWGN